MITFNNIVERFKIFAENHFFIETFSFGSPDDVDLTKFTSFPLMHLVYTGATYDPGTKTYNLEVYILDVPADKDKKTDRQKEVVSDAEQCAEDIIADIKNGGNIFLFAQDYEVVNATTTPLEEETKNVLSGVLLDLSVSIPYEWDACNAPIDGVTPEGGDEVAYARRGILRMLTQNGATDVLSVRTIKVSNGTLTDEGDGVVSLDTAGAESLNELTDVNITSLTPSQLLQYSGISGNWENITIYLSTLADTKGTPAEGKFLQYTGGFWQPVDLDIELNDLSDVDTSNEATFKILRYDGTNWIADNVPMVGSTGISVLFVNNIATISLDANLADLNNVAALTPSSGQVLTWSGSEWQPSPLPSPPPTVTELNDLDDVTITTPAANQILRYSGSVWQNEDLTQYHDRYQSDAATLRSGATATTEIYYSAIADGDGYAESASSDTPATGYDIRRKLYYSEAGFADPDTGTWTQFTAIADNTTFANAKAALLAYLKERTGGTVPISLKQTWEEVAQAPTFTGLLNESYGSGAAAAYSVRRLNGNVTECMVIRRASDSTTTTIGFDSNGNIDESAINTFCSGTTCTLVTWKDQSGNAVDASAVTEGTIYDAGALKKINGKLYIDGGKYDASFTGSSTGHLFMTLQRPPAALTRYIATSDSSNKYYFYGNDGNTGAPESGVTVNSYRFNGVTASSVTRDFVWDNTANQTQATVDVNDSALINRRLYFSSFDAPLYQEFIYYSSTKSTADRNSIESNIGDYFTQNTPLLDTYTGAAAAYSLRKLRSAYSGSAIRVRRASDNTEQDIGFNVFGELDTVSLASFCSGTNGFVKTWYDQSGSANDATQTTAANQPKIYDSTTGVVTKNNKPAASFDNTDFMPSAYNFGSNFSAYAVASSEDLSNNTNLVFSEYGTAPNTLLAYVPRTTSGLTVALGYVGTFAIGTGTPDTNQHAFVYRKNSTTISVRFDATAAANATTSATFVNSTFALSGTNNTLGGSGAKTISEVVIYDDGATNDSGIESNINTFYSIY